MSRCIKIILRFIRYLRYLLDMLHYKISKADSDRIALNERNNILKASKEMKQFLLDNPHLEQELLNQKHVAYTLGSSGIKSMITLQDLRTNNHNNKEL